MLQAAIPFPSIDPVLFSIGPLVVRWYALAYIAGLLGGWYYCRRLTMQTPLWGTTPRPTLEHLDDLIVWIALGVVGGGRLGYVLFYNFDYFTANPGEIIAVWRGGMSFHGGMLGAALAMVLFAKRKQLSALGLIDLVSVAAPIGLFFGRLANFINGELWGRAAPDLSFAVIFPNGGPVARHPSQIYEALTEGLVLFIILAWLVRRVGFHRPGLVGGTFLVCYSIFRIGCEVFREPDPQLGFLLGSQGGFAGGLTMGMVLSLPMALIGLVAIIAARRNTTIEPKA
jgi:phosphatidylglycerol---prolipoprotein diacylglyceryl transferase